MEESKIDNWTVFSDNCQSVDFVGLANIPSDDIKSLGLSLINKLSRKVIIQVEACKMLLKNKAKCNY